MLTLLRFHSMYLQGTQSSSMRAHTEALLLGVPGTTQMYRAGTWRAGG